VKQVELKNTFFRLFDGMYSTKKFGIPEAFNNFDPLDIPDEGYQKQLIPIYFRKLKNEGPLPDFVCTNICGRICSPKLKNTIHKHLTEADSEIQWLPMIIEDEGTGDKLEYYYLHFPKICDTLDMQHSTFSRHSGLVERVVFSYKKTCNRSIFNCPGSRVILACSKELKEAIFKAGCTGISVEPANVIQLVEEKRIL